VDLLSRGRAEVIVGRGSSIEAFPLQEFLDLWKDADPDVPVYREAKAEYAALLRSRAATAGAR